MDDEVESSGGVPLVLVGTPIGNLGDLTEGARLALDSADVICAEDTRRTRKLLSAYDIHPSSLISVRAENETYQAGKVVNWLRAGRRVALVSDAGMPTLSDPGQRLVSAVLHAGGAVTAAPGPDAATTALSLSGLAPGPWCFEGFLPKKSSTRSQRLSQVARERRHTVLYEAPHRLLATLADLEVHVGPHRPVAVVNDMTKLFEKAWRGPLTAVRGTLASVNIRGEFVVVVAGARPTTTTSSGPAPVGPAGAGPAVS